MISKGLRRAFGEVVGAENLFAHETDRLTYGYDAAVHRPEVPALVVRPPDAKAVGAVVRLCHENGVPLTVRGAGTNLSGGTIPEPDGIVVLTTGLARILEIGASRTFRALHDGFG